MDEAKTRNFEKWPVLGVYVWPNPFVGQTYAEEINYLKSWIHDRLLWMDNNMIGEPTGILENNFELINEFKLHQNYPNPFNPNTTIEFSLIKASSTKLSLYDVLGRQVKILVNEFLEPGSYSFNYKAEGISSGIYFVKIESGNYQSTIKMVYDK